MKTRRYFRYDLIRIAATLLVFFFHFSIEWPRYNNDSARGLLFFGKNLTLGQMGVVLFFMLSGLLAAKGFENRGAASMDEPSYRRLTLRYYRRRLLSILPVYWVCWLFMSACFTIAAHYGLREYRFHITRWFPFTLLGLDGYLSMSGIPTQYLVGEWFVGVILILYALFPLLYRLIRRFPKRTMAALCVLQAILLFLPEGGRPRDTLAAGRILDFSIGICLGLWPDPWTKSVLLLPAAGAGLLLLLGFTVPADLPVIITLTGLCAFVLLLAAGKKAEQCTSPGFHRLCTALGIFSACSFPFFLVHHQLLLFAMDFGASRVTGRGTFLLLCLTAFAAVFLAAFLLQKLTQALLTAAGHLTGFLRI